MFDKLTVLDDLIAIEVLILNNCKIDHGKKKRISINKILINKNWNNSRITNKFIS